MKRFLVTLLLVLASVSTTFAEELILRYQAVMHVNERHEITVLEQTSHRMGLAAFHGLAIFDDGAVIDHRYEGSYEISDQGVDFRGYALWIFDESTQLRASYEGAAVPKGEGIEFRAEFSGFSGTGRFNQVSGTGGFEGRRFNRLEADGSTYAAGELKLKLGSE